MNALPPLAYRIKDAAEKIGVSTVTVRRHIKSGLLPARKINRTLVLILAEDLDEFMGRRGAQHPKECP
jgi:excisionase family DNA binding protein